MDPDDMIECDAIGESYDEPPEWVIDQILEEQR